MIKIYLNRYLPKNHSILYLLIAWLLARLVTSFWAIRVSILRPLTELERTLPIWPPSLPTNTWLVRVFLLPWLRWDAVWYNTIVTQGYDSSSGTAAFHPLYPWLAKLFYLVGFHPLFSLIIVSSISTILLIIVFERLARLDLEPANAYYAALLFLASPVSFILFAPYTESLFLLCVVLSFLAARKNSWILAGLAGMFATLTRQQGIFLILPLAWELYETAGRNWRLLLRNWKNWLSLTLIPIAYIFWIAFRMIFIRDSQISLSSPRSFIFSVLISPSLAKVTPQASFMWPWQALRLAIGKFLVQPDLDLAIDLALAGLFLAATVTIIFSFPKCKLRISYWIYLVVIMLVAFSDHTGPVHPYMGLPRHLYLGFPIFIGLATIFTRPYKRLIIIVLGILVNLFLLAGYVLSGWVP